MPTSKATTVLSENILVDHHVLSKLEHQDVRERRRVLETLAYRLDSFVTLNKLRDVKAITKCFQDEGLRNRIIAMRTLWLCGTLNAGKIGSLSGIRMQIFEALASMINDQDPDIRINSCILTAALHVPLDLLLTTLSKKKADTLVSMNGSERIQDPGDTEVTDENDIREMSAASYGSFIHASEDEYLRVRVTVIDAIFQLGLKEKKYAELCIKFLIDMFNDEEALVRRVALQYVASLNSTWKFLIPDDNVDLYILALRDDDPFVKKFSHKMHSALNFKSKQGFEKIVKVLIAELNEIEDVIGPMEALSALSKNHAVFVADMITTLFDLKDGFLPKEFPLGDITHHAHLVMTYNAAYSQTDILNILPKYVIDRYDFIQSYYESLVPNFHNFPVGDPEVTKSNETNKKSTSLVTYILQDSVKKLSYAPKQLQYYIKMLEKSSSVSLSIRLCKQLLEYHYAFQSLQLISIYSDLYSAKKLVAKSVESSLELINEVAGLPVVTFQEFQEYLRGVLVSVSEQAVDKELLEMPPVEKSGVKAEIILKIPSVLRKKERSGILLKNQAFKKIQ